jgi:hypothetical protein
LVLAGSAGGVSAFFNRQPLTPDGFVERRWQHVQGASHCRHILALFQQLLRLLFDLTGELGFASSPWTPLEEALRSLLPIQRHIPLYCR